MLDRPAFPAPLTLSIGLIVLAALFLDQGPWIDRPEIGLALWRPLTAQFFHGNSWHAVHDLLLFIPLGLIHESRVGTRTYAAQLLLLFLAVPLGVRLCHEGWESYRGLSGVAYGLVPLVLLHRPRIDPLAVGVLAFLLTKSVFELSAGGFLVQGDEFRELLGIRLLVGSHLGGILAALGVVAWTRWESLSSTNPGFVPRTIPVDP